MEYKITFLSSAQTPCIVGEETLCPFKAAVEAAQISHPDDMTAFAGALLVDDAVKRLTLSDKGGFAFCQECSMTLIILPLSEESQLLTASN